MSTITKITPNGRLSKFYKQTNNYYTKIYFAHSQFNLIFKIYILQMVLF